MAPTPEARSGTGRWHGPGSAQRGGARITSHSLLKTYMPLHAEVRDGVCVHSNTRGSSLLSWSRTALRSADDTAHPRSTDNRDTSKPSHRPATKPPALGYVQHQTFSRATNWIKGHTHFELSLLVIKYQTVQTNIPLRALKTVVEIHNLHLVRKHWAKACSEAGAQRRRHRTPCAFALRGNTNH